ncbi:DNA-directed DNA polymerase II small subunit [Halovenus sp. HT40]|uniref:DNA-directed DNA polymerase II small subunit n=1 Tax=Halovenus sp. HT40 TaxID=3126691 RepID=UPI00300EC4DB
MPLETPARIVRALADRGYNAEREAVTLIANQSDPARAIERAVENAPESTLVLSAEQVREAIENDPRGDGYTTPQESPETSVSGEETDDKDPHVSTGTDEEKSRNESGGVPVETEGSAEKSSVDEKTPAETDGTAADSAAESASTRTAGATTGTVREKTDQQADGPVSQSESGRAGAESESANSQRSTDQREIEISGDIPSIGTGEYSDFVSVFQDRYEKLAKQLRGRVNHRPTDTIEQMSPGSDAALIGLVSDIRSTASGHWLVELEDTTGTFPCLIMKDREFASEVRNLLHDEVIAVEGTLADDGGILFVDSLHFPDIPRTHSPSTADRPVKAALISDVHCGSEEFLGDAWQRFADWLHTPEAESVEYLLIAGDMVEGVGVYPGQNEELEIVDIYEQYEAFSEHLKDVPGDMEIVMIPGNHDAVRLAEPQPAFDEELRDIMSAHDATISANPSIVTVEGVSVLMYHGVSLDEVIAELPDESATYERPHDAMEQLLRKRHVAPQYGGQTRVAPEPEDHLVMEEVPDIFHTGHVHKLGYGKYHDVLMVNSSCWQAQTDFQKKVNLDPDVGYAPIIDLQTLDLTIRQFV